MKASTLFAKAIGSGLAMIACGAAYAASFTQQTSKEFVANGDFDGDGILDVMVVDRDTGVVRVIKGNATGKLTPLGAMASGIRQPDFVSVGRLGDGTATAPNNDRALIGSADANRAVVVNPRFPAAVPRSLYQLGVAPEAAAVVQLSVIGGTVHEDILAKSRTQAVVPSGAGSDFFRPGQLTELLNKGTSVSNYSQSNQSQNFENLNVLTPSTATGELPLVAGFSVNRSPDGESLGGSLILLTPGRLVINSDGMIEKGLIQTPVSLEANSRFVVSIFGSDTTATFVIYSEGSSKAHVLRLIKNTAPGDPPFSFEQDQQQDLGLSVQSMSVVRSKAGKAQVAVGFDDGRATIYDVTDVGLEVVSSLVINADAGSVSALVAGANGVLHIMHADPITGRSTAVSSLADDGSGDWQPLTSDPVGLPPISKVMDLANVLVFDKQPFINADVRLLGAYRAGDWTQRLAFAGSGSSLTASATAETFRGEILGLGAASAVPLGSVAGPSGVATPGQLVNQYADNVSIFSLEEAQGEIVDVVTVSPPSGKYSGIIKATFSASAGTTIFVRSNTYENFKPYAGPMTVVNPSSIEYYAQVGSRRGVISRVSYEFTQAIEKLDSDGDGVPDFVELAKRLDPTAGADSDGDGFSDLAELLAGSQADDDRSSPSADFVAPNSSNLELAVTPAGESGFDTMVAAPGTIISAYTPNGHLLGSGATPELVSGQTAATIAVRLPPRALPMVALGTPGNMIMTVLPSQQSEGPLPELTLQSYPELVGLVPLPKRPAVVLPDFTLSSWPSDASQFNIEAGRWLDAYRSAWQEVQSASRMDVQLTVRDTFALLMLELKVTEIMRSRSMISEGQRANLTPWRTSYDASLITPTVEHWRQLEQADASGESLRPWECLQQIYSLIDSLADSQEATALQSLVMGVYAVASQREIFQALLVNSDSRDPKGSIGSPVDVLRYFLNASPRVLPPADGALLWGISALAAVDEEVAAMVAGTSDASLTVDALLGALTNRTRVSLTLVVPDPADHSELAEMKGVFLVDEADSTQVYRLLDAQGRDYEVTKGLSLPVGAHFAVTAFDDLVSDGSLTHESWSDLEVISMRWISGSVPELSDGEPLMPFITAFEAIDLGSGQALDIARPLLIADSDGAGVALSVSVEGDVEGLAYQWRRNGVAIADATDSSLQLDATALDFAGFYDVLITNVAGAVSSVTVETRVLPIRPVIDSLNVELGNEPYEGRNVLARLGDDVTLRVNAQSAASDMTYQWLRNGTAIPGETDSVLIIPILNALKVGTYTVRVTPVGVARASSNATLSDEIEVACVAPSVETVTRRSGEMATFLAYAYGKKLSYYWSRVGGASLVNAHVSGANTATLKIAGVGFSDIGTYKCFVEMAGQVRLEASSCTLNVLLPPLFIVGNPIFMPNVSVRGYLDWSIPVMGTLTKLTATNLPKGLSFDEANRRIYGTVAVEPGTYAINLSASNQYGTSKAVAQLLVGPLRPELVGEHVAYLPRNTSNSDLGGVLKVVVNSLGSLSGSVTLGTATHSLVGLLDTSDGAHATCKVQVISSAKAKVGNIDLSFRADEAILSGVFTSAINPAWTFKFMGWANYWKMKGVGVNPYAGRQNLALFTTHAGTNANTVSIPAGYGYLSAQVNAIGTVSYSGRTSDGELFSHSGWIGKSGQGGVFDLLYATATKGSIVGGSLFAGSDSASATGLFSWNRPSDSAATAKLYKAGYLAVNQAAVGGKYKPAPTGAPLLEANLLNGINRTNVFVSAAEINLSPVNPAAIFSFSRTNTFVTPTYASGYSAASVTAVNATNGEFQVSISRTERSPLTNLNVTQTLIGHALVVPYLGVPRAFGSLRFAAWPTLPGQTLLQTTQYTGGVLIGVTPPAN